MKVNEAKQSMMDGKMMGRGSMMDSDEALYKESQDEESTGQGPTIPKDLLPGELGVGDKLVITEDLGDSYRVEVSKADDSVQPEPGPEGEELE